MTLRLSTVALLTLASLTGCAPVGDDLASVDQHAIVPPGSSPAPVLLPDPCMSGPADATFTLPVPLLSPSHLSDTGTADFAGIYECDYHTVQFNNVGGLRRYAGFQGVSVGTATYADMTEADCNASTFSGFARAWHPPVGNVAGYWETLRETINMHAQWVSNNAGGGSCIWDPYQGTLHYFIFNNDPSVTTLRVGSRFSVRHGGVWVRRPVQTQGHFYPPGT